MKSLGQSQNVQRAFSCIVLATLMRLPATMAFVSTSVVQPNKVSSMAFTRHTVIGSSSSSSNTSNNAAETTQSSQLPLLLTFDLDDTLFPIGPVVQEANDAMYAMMDKLGVLGVTEDEYMSTTKAIRQSLTYPITYSELRKRAIATFVAAAASSSSSSSSNNNNNNEIDDYVVQEIFDAWVNERHLAAERYLFEGVKESLQKLTTLYENGQDDDDSISTTTTSTICIGAITNGRGNPLCMTNTLSSIFDFCVSGEDDGVFPARKPHEGIYQAALDIYHSSDKCIDPTNYIWIHVGDCLGNDVGASADCGAYAVWVSGPQDDESSSVDDGKQKWSTATPGELQVRAELAQAAKKKASATIRTVAELPNAVLQILDQVEASKVVSMS